MMLDVMCAVIAFSFEICACQQRAWEQRAGTHTPPGEARRTDLCTAMLHMCHPAVLQEAKEDELGIERARVQNLETMLVEAEENAHTLQ